MSLRPLIAVAAAVFVVGCGATGTSPTPKALSLSSLSVMYGIGNTSQLAAHEMFSDNSFVDVTSRTKWTSSNDSVASISPAGVLTSRAAGSVTISGSLDSLSTSMPVSVALSPPGGYLISVTIVDLATQMPIVHARTAIHSPTPATYITSEDAAGHYYFSGPGGPLQLLVEADGYVSQSRDLVVAGATTVDVALVQVAAADVSGNWSMTLSASASCQSQLPSGALQRQYDVTITQQGIHLALTLSSPTLVDKPGGVRTGSYLATGLMAGSLMTITLAGNPPLPPFDPNYGDVFYDLPLLVDQLSDTEWIGIVGTAQVSMSGGGAQSQANFQYYAQPLRADGQPILPVCNADGVVLVRK